MSDIFGKQVFEKEQKELKKKIRQERPEGVVSEGWVSVIYLLSHGAQWDFEKCRMGTQVKVEKTFNR